MVQSLSILRGAVLGAALLLPCLAAAEPNTGKGPSTHDCAGVAQTCGSWAPKGPNTCRTCQQAQCKTENGKDVLAGNKTTTECYEGHGSPPKSGLRPKLNLPKAQSGGVKAQ